MNVMCDLRGLSRYEINQYYFEFVRNATKEEYEDHGLKEVIIEEI